MGEEGHGDEGHEEGDGHEGHEEGHEGDGHEAEGHEEGHKGGGGVSRCSSAATARGHGEVSGAAPRVPFELLCAGATSLCAPGLPVVYIRGRRAAAEPVRIL